SLDQVTDELLKLGSSQLHIQVLRSRGVHGKVGQVDVGLQRRRQLNLGLFSGLLQSLHRHDVLSHIDALVLFEFASEKSYQGIIEIFTTKESVAIGGLDLKDALLNFENGNIKGTAAQIVHCHDFVFTLVHAVGDGGSGGLVDHTQNIEAGNLAGVLGGLTLGVVEVGRYRDDGILHRSVQIG